jgi:hypothetical protein
MVRMPYRSNSDNNRRHTFAVEQGACVTYPSRHLNGHPLLCFYRRPVQYVKKNPRPLLLACWVVRWVGALVRLRG